MPVTFTSATAATAAAVLPILMLAWLVEQRWTFSRRAPVPSRWYDLVLLLVTVIGFASLEIRLLVAVNSNATKGEAAIWLWWTVSGWIVLVLLATTLNLIITADDDHSA